MDYVGIFSIYHNKRPGEIIKNAKQDKIILIFPKVVFLETSSGGGQPA